MAPSNKLRTLVDQLDMIEWRIKAERARYGGWKVPITALLATGDAGPLAEHRASRRRVRTLERERERLLGLLDSPPASEADSSRPRAGRSSAGPS